MKNHGGHTGKRYGKMVFRLAATTKDFVWNCVPQHRTVGIRRDNTFEGRFSDLT